MMHLHNIFLSHSDQEFLVPPPRTAVAASGRSTREGTPTSITSISSGTVSYPSDLSFVDEESDALPPNEFYAIVTAARHEAAAKGKGGGTFQWKTLIADLAKKYP